MRIRISCGLRHRWRADQFDAEFFGYSPSEAEILDPQQRLFLECAWAALERAGYQGDTFDGSIGVYASSGFNTYLLNLHANAAVRQSISPFELFVANDKDFWRRARLTSSICAVRP